MATDPSFAATPARTVGQLTTAVTTIDNPASSGGAITNGVTLVTGASGGTKVLEVQAIVAGTSAIGIVRLYISSDTGTTWRLFDEINIPTAITAGTTTLAARPPVKRYDNLILPSTSWKLGATVTVTQTV